MELVTQMTKGQGSTVGLVQLLNRALGVHGKRGLAIHAVPPTPNLCAHIYLTVPEVQLKHVGTSLTATCYLVLYPRLDNAAYSGGARGCQSWACSAWDV